MLGEGKGGYPLLLPHLFSTNSSRFTILSYMEYLSLHPYNSSVVLTVVFSFIIHLYLSCSSFPSGNIKVTDFVFAYEPIILNPTITPPDWIEACIVSERQLRLHGHVTRFPEVNSAHRVVSINDNFQWKMSRGRPHSSSLEQVDRYCQQVLGMRRGLHWGFFGRAPGFGVVGWAKRRAPMAYAPVDWLIVPVFYTQMRLFIYPPFSATFNVFCRGFVIMLSR